MRNFGHIYAIQLADIRVIFPSILNYYIFPQCFRMIFSVSYANLNDHSPLLSSSRRYCNYLCKTPKQKRDLCYSVHNSGAARTNLRTNCNINMRGRSAAVYVMKFMRTPNQSWPYAYFQYTIHAEIAAVPLRVLNTRTS